MTVAKLKELVETDWQINDRTLSKDGRDRWAHPMRLLDGVEAREITIAVIESYKAKRLAEGAARKTINNEIGLVRRGLNLAFEQEMIPKVPRLRQMSVQNARQGFLDPVEFDGLERALRVLDPPVGDVVTWLYLLGWRREEVLGLEWHEVDVEAGTVRLPAHRTKNRAPKTVKVGHDLRELLQRRWALRNGPHVFHREGDRICTFKGPWKRAARAVGRPTLVPHDLRRSFARNALQAGVPVKLIMEIGGWKTMSVFFRYCIVDEALLERGVERVGGYVSRIIAEKATRKARRSLNAASPAPPAFIEEGGVNGS